MPLHLSSFGTGHARHCCEVVAHCEHYRLQGGGTSSVEDDLALLEQIVEALGCHAFEQVVFVVIVVVDGCAVEACAFGDLRYRDFFEGLFRQQTLKSLMKHLPRPPYTRVEQFDEPGCFTLNDQSCLFKIVTTC